MKLDKTNNNTMSVQLYGSENKNEGTVEILYNGALRTICGSNFNKNVANVICRMLNYSYYFL
jgi:hypothetical protein